MYTDQCISVTDLRRNTSKYLDSSRVEQFIFVDSKPRSALLTMSRYEELRQIEDRYYMRELDLHFVPYTDLSQEEQDRYEKALKTPKHEFIDF